MSKQHHSQGVIPDFCSLTSVLVVILLSEIFAVLATLLSFDSYDTIWTSFGMHSFFMIWTTLCVSALLCLLRHWLNTLPLTWIVFIVIALVLLITCLTSFFGLFYYKGLSLPVIWHQYTDWFIRNLIVVLILTLLLIRYFYLQHQYREGLSAESRARFESLQAKIHPHFLFNTLNTIASLISIDHTKAEQTLEHLANLLRKSLNEETYQVSLEEEIRLCHHYLAIEQQRLGDRLKTNWQIDPDVLTCKIPSFTLQPLIENAVYHGIQSLIEGGTIMIEAKRYKQSLHIMISNPLPKQKTPSGNQMAHNNIQQRLMIRYGVEATMKIKQDNECYQVILTIPQERSS